MPELPEVETTRRGIAPYVAGKTLRLMTVRERRLRWPVEAGFEGQVAGQVVRKLSRRAKYLVFEFDAGYMLLHLGMSGSLRVVDADEPVGKHDHVDFEFEGGKTLRFRDPRRFGSVHWFAASIDEGASGEDATGKGSVEQHWLLEHLGPEPLSHDFSARLLYTQSRNRKVAVKNFIMDGKVVVGVGNIYANEALFRAGISPKRAAGKVSAARYERLVAEIKAVLGEAIEQGGTTLKDFVGGDGETGYFAVQLQVYGREGKECLVCERQLSSVRIGQRATVFCSRCQK